MLNDNYHSSVFVGRRLCKLIVFRGLVIEVSITVVGPSGALWEWIYRCKHNMSDDEREGRQGV